MSQASNMDLKAFNSVFDEILQCLTKNIAKNPELDVVSRWTKRAFEYNMSDGKRLRGLAVVDTFKSLAPPEKLTEENVHLSRILGWCVEMFQTYQLMADDIVDQSETRRGKLCWYKNEDVGFEAIIDALTMENAIFFILKQYFRNMDCYVPLLELFLETIKETLTGQTLDGITSSKNQPLDFSIFTSARYATITEYKTAYYTYCFPVRAGLYLSGISDDKIHEQIKPALFLFGYMLQMQDDYIDCYGDPAITGKIGTDIQGGKCCWPIVTALEYASDDQRNVLMKNYGKSNKENVANVKAIYEELHLPVTYKKCEKECYDEAVKLIKVLPEGIKIILQNLLDTIYGRIR